jgi:hypothetical protein
MSLTKSVEPPMAPGPMEVLQENAFLTTRPNSRAAPSNEPCHLLRVSSTHQARDSGVSPEQPGDG